MSTRTGGRILVDQLVAQGCDRIFHVPGESFLAVLDALHDTPQIDLVTCRQEGGAAFMACADGQLTGRPGIAFVTRGPGATNASIGVHVARQDSVPMILFIGDIDRGFRDREGFQEVDFPAMFAPLAKWATRIEDAARIPEYLHRAYRVAMSGRPGPVVIALPEDMLMDAVEAVDRPFAHYAEQPIDPRRVDQLLDMVETARRPVAIVGGAAWGLRASEAFSAFAEAAGIPVVAAFRRQDAVDNALPVYAGNLGYGPNPKLVGRVKDADLLLVIGPRLGEATTDGYTLVTPEHPGQTLIHIHPDPDELGRTYRTDMALCADVANACEALANAAPRLRHRTDGGEAHADYLAWSTPQPRDTALDLAQVVGHMVEALPSDAIICNGAGNFSGWWHRYWPYAGPGTQLAPTAGAMGYGLPAAIAASLRRPRQLAIAVAGDGDVLMNGQELATAVQHGCDLLVLVVDNGNYGTIRMHQEREFPERVSGTQLSNPDFAAWARAFGGWAVMVERTAAFAPALAQAMAVKGARLLHLKTDVELITAGTTLSAVKQAKRG